MPLGHIKKKTIQLQITSQNFSLGEPKSICMSCDMVFMCKLDSKRYVMFLKLVDSQSSIV